MEKIGIASDHAGFKLKAEIIKYLSNKGFEIKDFGTFSEEPVDYPDFAHPLALSIEDGNLDRGIGICGSGNGINMTLNKHQKIRSALCWNKEIAELAIKHNAANICALPGRFLNKNEAFEIVDTFFNSRFEKGRHQNRIDKIPL